MVDVSLVLMDLSLNLIACGRGAAAILNSYPPGPKGDAAAFLPREVMELVNILRGRKLAKAAPLKIHFHVGKIDYICRAYLLESLGGMAETMVALHLERVSSVSDGISNVGPRYRLTEREREALGGISMGLATKEIAERMNISPNTVKAFIRVIRNKMSAAARNRVVVRKAGQSNRQ